VAFYGEIRSFFCFFLLQKKKRAHLSLVLNKAAFSFCACLGKKRERWMKNVVFWTRFGCLSIGD